MMHYSCGASNKIKDFVFRTPSVLKERNDATHLIASSLPKSWNGPCLYMAWNPKSAWINKMYIGSTTRSFSTRFKEHVNCIMIVAKNHDIPFYQITKQDGSFADTIFSPIVYFESGITQAQCQAPEFMIIGSHLQKRDLYGAALHTATSSKVQSRKAEHQKEAAPFEDMRPPFTHPGPRDKNNQKLEVAVVR